jgi:transposase-like protein
METINAFDKRFPDDNACKAYLAAHRWPDGVRCPRCNRLEKVYAINAKPFHWRCRNDDCGGRNSYKFSVTTHTIFQDTKIPLKLWFKVAFLILTSKKGISALQVHRVMFGEDSGSDYRTSWFMCMRWRAAMKGDVLPLEGEVEVDETFIGGKERNKHASQRKHIGTGGVGKVAVIGAIARKGMWSPESSRTPTSATLDGFIRETVSKNVRLLATDEHTGYRLLGKDMNHRVVRHGAGEYVVGTTHTNTIEGFWSLFRRGIVGSYHKVSKDYLPLYLNEFSWRFNNRKNPDMFADLITTCSK